MSRLEKEAVLDRVATRLAARPEVLDQRRDSVEHPMTGQPPSPRQVAKLVTSEPDAVPETERAFLARLLAEAPALGDAAAIAKRIGRLLRREGGDSLDCVLADGLGTPLAEFTAGFARDRAAVQAALDMPWTTGPAEGQINRVKAIKRMAHDVKTAREMRENPTFNAD